jgi:hypothetical protein
MRELQGRFHGHERTQKLPATGHFPLSALAGVFCVLYPVESQRSMEPRRYSPQRSASQGQIKNRMEQEQGVAMNQQILSRGGVSEVHDDG